MAGVNSVIAVVLLLACCCCLGGVQANVHSMYASHEPVRASVPLEYNVSAQCTEKVMGMMFNKTNLIETVLALDAFGKPKAGFLAANWAWLGHYDECKSLSGYNYCLVSLDINGTKLLDGNKTLMLNTSLDEDDSGEVNSLLQDIKLQWGICPPASCSSQDIQALLLDLIDELNLLDGLIVGDDKSAIKTSLPVCAEDPTIPYNAGFICTVVLCCFIAALMILGALYDVYLRMKAKNSKTFAVKSFFWPLKLVDEFDDDEEEVAILAEDLGSTNARPAEEAQKQSLPARILLCFAFNRNLAKLFDVKQGDSSIGCLNGIRVISMTWVILGHILVFGYGTGIVGNSLTLLNQLKSFGFQAVGNAFFAVDSFFFLSGFLLAYITLNRFGEIKTASRWALFYFHRFWRLTPLLAFVMLLYMYLPQSFGSGPVWQTGAARPACPKYWWTNLLYINNFWPVKFSDECIGWVWYLANDMQFFIVSPLFLAPLYYYPIAGGVVLLSTLIASFITTGAIIGVYDLPLNILDIFMTQSDPNKDFFSLVYGKPYCRIAPYLVGIGLGYAMYRIGKRRVKLPLILNLFGWIVATGLGIGTVYGLYPSFDKNMSLFSAIIYGSVSRFFWALAVAWVVFSCKYGYGAWINSFLSWSFWVPLGRVTYGAYLIHPIVIEVFYNNFQTSIFLTEYLIAFYFVGAVALAYFIAILLALAIEYPFANLEKILLPSPRGKRSKGVTGEVRNGKVPKGNGLSVAFEDDNPQQQEGLVCHRDKNQSDA